MNEEVLRAIREKKLILEKDVFDLIDSFSDGKDAVKILDNLERASGQKFISKSLVTRNFEFVKNVLDGLPNEDFKKVERTFVKIGISLEVQKQTDIVPNTAKVEQPKGNVPITHQIFYSNTKAYKKLEVNDFVNHFRARYQQIQRILMSRPELSNLVSINKISSERQNLSIIGIVTEKRITKNGNYIIKFEDLTGMIQVVARSDNRELFEKAEELQLDDVVGVKGAGNRDMIFARDIYFPDSFIFNKTKFDNDVSIAFLSDVHCGSDRHLAEAMERFLDWINSDDEEAKKVQYIFFSGDNVDGVGIFPGQEHVLRLKSMKEQYVLLASYLRRIPKHITMFMCPGQHDAVRVAEPQPIIDRRYAPELYEIENLVLVTNPTLVKLIERDKEFKVLMYHGASIHSMINEIKELRNIKAHKCPAKAVRHLLKRRHLSPTHSSVVYIPNEEKDPLVISEVPDVLCTGEMHRVDIENYNGVTIIVGSCWQARTNFEEKIGNFPDPCKVPVMNLKSRELKILDFSTEEDRK